MIKNGLIISNKPENDLEVTQMILELEQQQYKMVRLVEEQQLDALELLIIFLDVPNDQQEFDSVDFDQIDDQYEEILLARIPEIERALSLMGKGKMKRICFISDETASISNTRIQVNYGAQLISSSIHMFSALLFNELRPKGFTFRMFSKKQGLAYAVPYFLQNRSDEAHDLKHSDEERFVMRNGLLQEIPW